MADTIKATGYDTVLPVFLGTQNADGTHSVDTQVFGTSFGIGAGYLLTAAHVTAGAKGASDRSLFVGFADSEGVIRLVPIAQHETLGSDIALLRLGVPALPIDGPFHQIHWSNTDLEPFATVSTLGYPYGTHQIEDRTALALRVFAGHIVSRLIKFKPVGFWGSPFRAYELSFMAPRGLSGAPLLRGVGSNPIVQGLIIGNSESKMLVHRDSETIRDVEETTIVEQYDRMTLGMAVTSGEIMSMKSSLIGGTISDHLQENGLFSKSAGA